MKNTAYFKDGSTLGIEDVEEVAVRCVNGEITISGAEGEMVAIFDVMGRMLVCETFAEGKSYEMPHNGVYMVKVGDGKAQKVVVMK